MSGQTCFVVMGYGIKKLPGTFIKLNLDDIYFNFIKPVIEACGLESLYAEQAYGSGVGPDGREAESASQSPGIPSFLSHPDDGRTVHLPPGG